MAKARKSGPPTKPEEPKSLHLTASMRVLRAHLARPALTVGDAHNQVKELARRLGADEPAKDDLVLEEKLRKATGVNVAELARLAADWPAEP